MKPHLSLATDQQPLYSCLFDSQAKIFRQKGQHAICVSVRYRIVFQAMLLHNSPGEAGTGMGS